MKATLTGADNDLPALAAHIRSFTGKIKASVATLRPARSVDVPADVDDVGRASPLLTPSAGTIAERMRAAPGAAQSWWPTMTTGNVAMPR